MKKIWASQRIVSIATLVLFFVISTFIPVASVRAEGSTAISFEADGIILPNSDIQLISFSGSQFFALVRYNGKSCLFSSQNQGKTWQKINSQGLPDNAQFIILKTLNSTVVLATKTTVFLFRDGGERFESLAGPAGLQDRGEEITSLALTGGNPPAILVGVWNPGTGKFAQEGVYAWGFGGSRWQPQGMQPTWPLQGRGYKADVTAVDFIDGNMIVVATGDPDGTGPLPEGTYLNIGSPSGTNQWGANWNFIDKWPIEISRASGQSAKESEILTSQIASDFAFSQEKIYVFYNTRQKAKDDIYLFILSENQDFNVTEIHKLEFPERAPTFVRFTSITYIQNLLAVGFIKQERATNSAQVYSLQSDEERNPLPFWNDLYLRADNSNNCQLMALPDGNIFAATSGPNSSFSRLESNYRFKPFSLINASGAISQIQVFSKDKVVFFNYGSNNIFKIVWDDKYQMEKIERVFFAPSGFDSRAKIQVSSDGTGFIFEPGKNTYWRQIPSASVWQKLTTPTIIADAIADNDKVWFAGKDGLVYSATSSSTFSQTGTTSGLAWIAKLEKGPQGKVIAIGGSREGLWEAISLISENSYQGLISLPISTSNWQLAYSVKTIQSTQLLEIDSGA